MGAAAETAFSFSCCEPRPVAPGAACRLRSSQQALWLWFNPLDLPESTSHSPGGVLQGAPLWCQPGRRPLPHVRSVWFSSHSFPICDEMFISAVCFRFSSLVDDGFGGFIFNDSLSQSSVNVHIYIYICRI